MQCEICGREGANSRIELDGIEMCACANCAAFGRRKGAISDEFPRARELEKKNYGNAESRAHFAPRSRSEEMESVVGALPEGLGTIVRRAREKKGLTIRELAEKVFEKESVLHRIEQNRALPDARLQARLESFFGVRLASAAESAADNGARGA